MQKNRFILIYLTLFTTFIYGNNDCPKYFPMPSMDGLVVVIPIGTKSVPDIDCDGIVDSKDRDMDGDGIPDKNPQDESNGWDADANGDGTLDNESDDNHDGWNDTKANEDADGDGYTNKEEVENGTDPYNPEPFIFALNTAGIGNELWITHGEANNTHLLKDINKNSNNTNSNPGGFVKINNITYFVADDGIHGRELWKSDGTEAGTVMIKDINTGEGSSSPSNLININGTLFFTADGGTNGQGLWKSNGTKSSTVFIKNMSTNTSFTHSFTNLNGSLFFYTYNGLWKSDGTKSGTVVVKDNGGSFYVNHLIASNGTLYFDAGENFYSNAKFWKSDGTTEGTIMIKDFGGDGMMEYKMIDNITSINNNVFFTISNMMVDPGMQNSYELWKSDGTETGTKLLKRFISDIDDSILITGEQPDNSSLSSLVNVNGMLFFSAIIGTNDVDYFDNIIYRHELWKSDGTVAGTLLVKHLEDDISPVGASNLINIDGTLFFNASTYYFGEIWKSDGTSTGTSRIYFGSDGTIGNLYGDIFFKDFDGSENKNILLKSDGTQAGTVEIGRY